MSYYLSSDGQQAIAQIPKAGLRTMQSWLNSYGTVPNDDEALLACPVRVLFVRNPINRLVSSFSFFRSWTKRSKVIDPDIPLDNWHVYVDYILEGHHNVHWMRQVERAGHLQTVVHRFEELGNIFYRYYPGPIDCLTKNIREPVDAYRLDEIVKYYQEDFDLWLGAEI